MFLLRYCVTVLLLGIAVDDAIGQATPVPCNVACTYMYAPVCASNGLTYANLCTMNSISCIDGLELTLNHNGPCP